MSGPYNEVYIIGSDGKVNLVTPDLSHIFNNGREIILLKSNEIEDAQNQHYFDDVPESSESIPKRQLAKDKDVKFVTCERHKINSARSNNKVNTQGEVKLCQNAGHILKTDHHNMKHKSTLRNEIELCNSSSAKFEDRDIPYPNVTSPQYRKTFSKLHHKAKSNKIHPTTFKQQLMDTSDIISPLILLPHTKKLMKISSWNFSESVTVPQHPISHKHRQYFQRNCISSKEQNEFDTAELNLMPLGYKPEIDISKIKRIVRKRKNPSLFITDDDKRAKQIKANGVSAIMDENSNGINNYADALVETVYGDDNYFFVDADIRDAEEIVVLPDDDGTSETTIQSSHFCDFNKSNNIDVLLAAAANNIPNNKSNVVSLHESAPSSIAVQRTVYTQPATSSSRFHNRQSVIFLSEPDA